MSELGVVVYGGLHWAWTVENMLQRQRPEIGKDSRSGRKASTDRDHWGSCGGQIQSHKHRVCGFPRDTPTGCRVQGRVSSSLDKTGASFR